jgi:hypothetical protein
MLHTLRKPANKGFVWIVDGGLLEFNLLDDKQITIHAILSTKPGVGSQLLERLLDYGREHEATCLLAKCPTDLESNAWYEKKGFKLVRIEDPKSKSGRKLNVWRLPLLPEEPASTGPRDGFLYHPDGDSPTAQLKRLLAGEHNPGFDDLFSATIDEADTAIREAEKERKDLLERLLNTRRKIQERKAHRAKVEQAIQHFRKTGEADDVLIPECRKLIAEERKADAKADAEAKADEKKAATADLAKQIGDGWHIDESRVDDEFVYITVKRHRTAVAPDRPSNDEIKVKVRERVWHAFDAYRFDFKDRVRAPRFMTTPASPRAP